MKQCPACNYELTMAEQAKDEGKCPKCDIYFAKYLARQSQAANANEASNLRQVSDRKGGSKLFYLVGALLVAGLLYVVASPFLVVHSIQSAVEQRDAEALSSHVDYPVFRQNMKDQVNARIMEEVTVELEGNPFAAMGIALASKVVDSVVDSMITPAGIARMMQGEKPAMAAVKAGGAGGEMPDTGDSQEPVLPAEHEQPAQKPFEDASMGYESLSRFVVTFTDESGEEVRFIFHRHGIADWLLSDMTLPAKK
ncbi:DUF2939 domain-containing protein [Pseudomonas neustonica]|uniref:DUF2939 domain-containing protein n=1 Tax=Pseudomonas neustonica TaxID=2487346 RepID=A0ABX9XGM1_9PSED|nr:MULTISPECIES: DUF2939 domain-containing protein [Pseudomonas]ROZ80895.1 DUF2939 domain-containing protein [Pseudomonas sp. SSM44]ROZ82092.1 DUF2939 domain-containing protein [Pseudomonas neustonica]